MRMPVWGRSAGWASVNHRPRVADGTGATGAFCLPVADGPAKAVATADFVMGKDRAAARQMADDAAAAAVISAGG